MRARIRRAAGAVRKALDTVEGAVVLFGRSVVSNLLEIAGGLGIAYGAWLMFRPAGFIVGGILAIGYAFLLDSGGSKR